MYCAKTARTCAGSPATKISTPAPCRPATIRPCRYSASAIPDRCFRGMKCCGDADCKGRLRTHRYNARRFPSPDILMTNPRVAELIELLKLERLEDNLFRGASRDIGTRYVFGGQVLGQALSAAQQTVD